MIKLSLILLQVAIAVLSVDFGDDKLLYLASFKSEIGVQQSHFNEIEYYISTSAAVWSGANEFCRYLLGPDGSLVTIQSEAEMEFLATMLDNNGYGFGSTYWTGIEEPLPPFLPPTNPVPLSRVALYSTNQYVLHIRFLPSTQLHRYICEFRRT